GRARAKERRGADRPDVPAGLRTAGGGRRGAGGAGGRPLRGGGGGWRGGAGGGGRPGGCGVRMSSRSWIAALVETHSMLTRRELLSRSGMGMASLGLAGLLANEARSLGAPLERGRAVSPLAPKKPHFPGKAKRVIHIFLNGGPSHVDSFD